jgi:hypothetical protein
MSFCITDLILAPPGPLSRAQATLDPLRRVISGRWATRVRRGQLCVAAPYDENTCCFSKAKTSEASRWPNATLAVIDYDKAFQITMGDRTMTFDSFECAIQAMHLHARLVDVASPVTAWT